MLASLPSQQLESDLHPLVNPQRFPTVRNRSNWFHLVERMFVESIYVYVGRLTDPGKNGSYENLSVFYIIDCLDWGNGFKSELQSHCEAFTKFRELSKNVLNKICAHADLHTYISRDSLAGFRRNDLEVFLSHLQDFVTSIHTHEYDTAYPLDSVMLGDAHDLVKILRGGVIFWELFEREPLKYDEMLMRHEFRGA